MPLRLKIEILGYVIFGFLISCAIAYFLHFKGFNSFAFLMIGLLPCTAVAFWLTYMFYPKFDFASSIKFDHSKKLIAITFDDGPTVGFTDEIIYILKQKSVPATFFMIGKKIEENQKLAIEVLKLGNEIGAHTYTHKKLHFSNNNDIENQIGKTVQLVKSIYEKAGFKGEYKNVFRSPHGFKSFKLKMYLKKHGLALIPWTRGVWDTDAPGSKWIIDKATYKPKSNEILLLHDGLGLNTEVSKGQKNDLIAALPKIIDFYKNRGYTFIKVSDFIR